nr:hypothetical protein 13 [bacterium]
MNPEAQTMAQDRLLKSFRHQTADDSSMVAVQLSDKKKNVIKIPNKTLKIITNIFKGRKIRREDFEVLVDGFVKHSDKNYYLQRECDDAVIEYFVPQSIVDERVPSLTGMERTYYCALIMGLEQGTDVVTVKPKRVLELMGYSAEEIKARSGMLYKNLKLDFRTLAGMLINYEEKGSTGEKILIGSPIGYCKDSNGITIEINKLLAGGINFKANKVAVPYTEIPKKLLVDKDLPIQEKNLRIQMRKLINSPKMLFLQGATILKWAQVEKATLAIKKRRDKAFSMALDVIERMKFKLININKSASEKDCRKWKLTYRAPARGATKGQFTDMDSPEVVAFIDMFVAWQGRDAHYGQGKAKNTPERIRELITNTIKGHGFQTVKKINDAVQKTGDPSPRHFWKAISEEKKKQENKKEATCG